MVVNNVILTDIDGEISDRRKEDLDVRTGD
jgi:hypothetical protein